MHKSTETADFVTVEKRLNKLTVDGQHLSFNAIDRAELAILLLAGVKVADFEAAMVKWGTTSNPIGSDWGYIRTVALRRRAEIFAVQTGMIQ
jgi:hypothetical protein